MVQTRTARARGGPYRGGHALPSRQRDPAWRAQPSWNRCSPPERRFELHADGEVPILTYRITGDRIRLIHTEVPRDQRGRGYADMIACGARARRTRSPAHGPAVSVRARLSRAPSRIQHARRSRHRRLMNERGTASQRAPALLERAAPSGHHLGYGAHPGVDAALELRRSRRAHGLDIGRAGREKLAARQR